MLNVISIMEIILDIANCTESQDNNKYIAMKVIEYSQQLPDMPLDDFLFKTHINANQFKKFYQLFNYHTYTKFKEAIQLWNNTRKKQYLERYAQTDLNKLSHVIYQLTDYHHYSEFINEKLIDDICYEINHSKRMILYGSVGLLNLTHDFQIDMNLFGINVLRSSLDKSKAIFPKNNDFLCFLSMTGRIFNTLETKTNIDIINSTQKKLLISQHAHIISSDYFLSINTSSDYYENKYVLMLYFDLIKTRYYELFVKENWS